MSMDNVELHNLPSDILRRIVQCLPDESLAHFSTTCRRGRSIFNEESLWERKVTEIIQYDPAFQAISHVSASVLRAWFRDPPYHVIYKLLISLGIWPEGIWREQPSRDHQRDFRGRMIKVFCLPGGRFLGEVHSSQKDYPAFHLQLAQINDWWPGLAITYLGTENAPSVEFWQTIDAPLEDTASSACGKAFVPRQATSCYSYNRGRKGPHFATLQKAEMKAQISVRKPVPMLFCCHPPDPPLPDALPPLTAAPRQAPSADAILGRLQGLYSSSYGPHGVEVLHITYGVMDPPLSELLPHGKCFAGLKITGDANVPAGRVSFCVSAEYAVPGPYSGFELEEVARGVFEDINRDIVKYGHGPDGMHVELVDIAERPVVARYYGLGQINASTRLWSPKWVEVQIIAYSDEQPTFSLLWADPGRNWRHIMDFEAMQLYRRPPLSEMLA